MLITTMQATRPWIMLFAAALLAVTADSVAESRRIELVQGTDLEITAADEDHIIFSLAGRLWKLPAEGGDATPLTPDTIHARRPTLSPDGRTLAYEALNDGRVRILLADPDGRNSRELSGEAGQQRAPAWSPDGRQLAVASDRDGRQRIWLVEVATGTMTALSHGPGEDRDPAWSPDGKSLAWVREAHGRSQLIVQHREKPERVLVDGVQRLHSPAWRPDGTLISFARETTGGTRLQMAILSEPPVLKPLVRSGGAGTGRVLWTNPDGLIHAADGRLWRQRFGSLDPARELPFRASIAITAAAAPRSRQLPPADAPHAVRTVAGMAALPDGQLVVAALGDLWVIDEDGRPRRSLSSDAFVETDPSISADGRRLAYISDRSGKTQIWLKDLGSGADRRLSSEEDEVLHPVLSPDASQLAYLIRLPGGEQRLKLLDLDDDGIRELAAELSAAGRPGWSPDGRRIAMVQDEGSYRRLLLFSTDGITGPRRILLPLPVAAPGRSEAAWSADGRSLAIASAAGIRVLPVLDDGLVGADWSPRHDAPVHQLQWMPDGKTLLAADTMGLLRVAADGSSRRQALQLDWRSMRGEGRTVIRAGRLFTGLQDGYLLDQKIVIDDGRVSTVEDWSDDTDASGNFIDASTGTVMPGLIDLGLELPATAGAGLGHLLLAFGITTAQVTAAADAEVMEVSARWQSHAAGPRLLQKASWCTDQPMTEAREPVMMGSVSLCRRVALAAQSQPLQQSIEAPLWSAHWPAAASGRITAIGPIIPSLPGRADDQSPLLFAAYRDALDIMLRAGVILVPELASRGLPVLAEERSELLDSLQYQGLVDPRLRQLHHRDWRHIMQREGRSRRAWLRNAQQVISRFTAGGGRLAFASSSPATPYGLGLHAQLALLAEAGIAPSSLLRGVTSEAARALGLQEEIGSIAAGQQADLLIIDGDPLSRPGQLLAIRAVMVGGVLRSVPDLLSDVTHP